MALPGGQGNAHLRPHGTPLHQGLRLRRRQRLVPRLRHDQAGTQGMETGERVSRSDLGEPGGKARGHGGGRACGGGGCAAEEVRSGEGTPPSPSFFCRLAMAEGGRAPGAEMSDPREGLAQPTRPGLGCPNGREPHPHRSILVPLVYSSGLREVTRSFFPESRQSPGGFRVSGPSTSRFRKSPGARRLHSPGGHHEAHRIRF